MDSFVLSGERGRVSCREALETREVSEVRETLETRESWWPVLFHSKCADELMPDDKLRQLAHKARNLAPAKRIALQ